MWFHVQWNVTLKKELDATRAATWMHLTHIKVDEGPFMRNTQNGRFHGVRTQWCHQGLA